MKNTPSNILHFLILIFISTATYSSQNLKNHPSPYIRMHANDAVKWHVWDQSVIDQAKKENKIIYISIGYYACHWCHVMRKESFLNKEVGDYINTNFIAVKVDRELNPALDNYLMTFLNNTQGYGGWPLNVFVTPQGYPLIGMVYKPAEKFKIFITNIQAQWKSKDMELSALAEQTFEFFNLTGQKTVKLMSVKELNKILMLQLHQSADELEGGLGSQSKFPRPPLLLVLLDLYQQDKDEWLKEFLTLTLDQMMTGGLHDVIGGGFFRYTVDPNWKIPHFEKMLYTNAGLIQVYLKAYKIFKNKKYLQVAIETTEFMIRDMKIGQGGFASSINSQDKQGIEGGGYIWDRKQLEKTFNTQQIKKIKKHWVYIDMESTENIFPTGLALGLQWQEIKQRLREKRKSESHGLDDKRLPSWNGYALSALAKIVKASERKDFKQAGEDLYHWLIQQAENGLSRPGAGNRKYLEDYAFVAQGLSDWQKYVQTKATVTKKQTERVKKLLNDSIKLFVSTSGWRLSDTQLLPMPSDQLNLPDAQLPASDVVVLSLLHQFGLSESLSKALRVTKRKTQLDAGVTASPVDFASQTQYQQRFAK